LRALTRLGEGAWK